MQAKVKQAALPTLTLVALGVVFGDIGTSPLYALKECFHAAHGIAINASNVLGILSLIFWSLMIVVSLKYVAFIMRANNNGEGGIMALLALNMRSQRLSGRMRAVLIAVGLFGAALFFGDGIITPAVSVLSAVEGLSIATPVLTPYVVPLTMIILVMLFVIQRKGTGAVGKFFGPITLLWFASIGFFGLLSIIKNPYILNMLNPYWAFHFVFLHPGIAFFAMGAVVLTITGGEALYADMGHFGRKPIQLAWFLVVLPCLVLNYAGQGALLLSDHGAVENPFYKLLPDLALFPMIALATMATVIASQAVISGVFSVARQAMQLGYLPRLTVMHTSDSEVGQIYIPFLNWLLLGSILLLVATFQSSSNLAAAYGLAVTMTMICDTILVSFVLYNLLHWTRLKVLLLVVPFLLLDLVFFAATSLKFFAGGWFPLLVGVTVFTVMMTWNRGRALMLKRMQRDTLPLDVFVKSFGPGAHIVSGTAVFMTSSTAVVPHALLHNLKHNKVVHERNILMTINTLDIPYVPESERVEAAQLNERFVKVVANYGFKEQPDAPQVLEMALNSIDQAYDAMSTSFFVSRERLVQAVGDSAMAPWRDKLFISMQRNTSPVSDFFQIPANRVVEMGSQIEI